VKGQGRVITDVAFFVLDSEWRSQRECLGLYKLNNLLLRITSGNLFIDLNLELVIIESKKQGVSQKIPPTYLLPHWEKVGMFYSMRANSIIYTRRKKLI
jgi:hypothetical protein